MVAFPNVVPEMNFDTETNSKWGILKKYIISDQLLIENVQVEIIDNGYVSYQIILTGVKQRLEMGLLVEDKSFMQSIESSFYERKPIEKKELKKWCQKGIVKSFSLSSGGGYSGFPQPLYNYVSLFRNEQNFGVGSSPERFADMLYVQNVSKGSLSATMEIMVGSVTKTKPLGKRRIKIL
jgi:hypothetical protein